MASANDIMDTAEEPKIVAGDRQMKRSPNRLLVDESHGEGDNSVVMLSMRKMEGT